MDGTENQQDKSSGGEQGTSVPETLTKEQATEMANKAAQDALSAAGRTAKALEVREAAIKAAEERSVAALKAKDEAELEDARDDKEKLTVLDARHKARDAKAELAKVSQELSEEKEKGKQRDAEAAETGREITVFEIATKHTVDAQRLKELSKLTDGSTEAIEAIAQNLPKKVEKPPLITDSGKTVGGGTMPESAKGKIRAGWDELHK